MNSKQMLLKAFPVLLCIIWAILIIPHSTYAGNCKSCENEIDLSRDCYCSNVSRTVGGENICKRYCLNIEQISGFHNCKTVSAEATCYDNPPYKNVAKKYYNAVEVSVGTKACTDDDYGDWIDCDNFHSYYQRCTCD